MNDDNNNIDKRFKIPTFKSRKEYDDYITRFPNLKLPEIEIIDSWTKLTEKVSYFSKHKNINTINTIDHLDIRENNNLSTFSSSPNLNLNLNLNVIRQDMVSNIFWSSIQTETKTISDSTKQIDLHNYEQNKRTNDNNKHILKKLINNVKRSLSSHFSLINKQNSTQNCVDPKILFENTLTKLFYDNGHGLFVEIENNVIKSFVPFINHKFKNKFWRETTSNQKLRPQYPKYLSWDDYYSQYRQNHPDHKHEDSKKTSISSSLPESLTSCFVINDILIPLKEIERLMQNQLHIIRDMFDILCSQRQLTNAQFFIKLFDNDNNDNNDNDTNNKENPKDKNNDNDIDIDESIKFSTLPIFSFCSLSNKRIKDILVPSKDDWLIASEKYFYGIENIFKDNPKKSGESKLSQDPLANQNVENIENIFDLVVTMSNQNLNNFLGDEDQEKNDDQENDNWSKKSNILFWRGSTLSQGLTIDDNMRLSLASLNRYQKFPSTLLDAAVTNIDAYERITLINSDENSVVIDFFNQKTNFVRQDNSDEKHMLTLTNIDQRKVRVKKFCRLNDQVQIYKYMIHLDSGCAPSHRYPYLMKNKILIFKVESTWKTWYSDLLVRGTDHLAIKSDLSNLHLKHKWAEENTQECLQIVKNSQYLYQNFLSEKGILDFWQYIINLYSKCSNQYHDRHERKIEQEKREMEQQITNGIGEFRENIKNFKLNLHNDKRDRRNDIESALFTFGKFEELRYRQSSQMNNINSNINTNRNDNDIHINGNVNDRNYNHDHNHINVSHNNNNNNNDNEKRKENQLKFEPTFDCRIGKDYRVNLTEPQLRQIIIEKVLEYRKILGDTNEIVPNVLPWFYPSQALTKVGLQEIANFATFMGEKLFAIKASHTPSDDWLIRNELFESKSEAGSGDNKEAQNEKKKKRKNNNTNDKKKLRNSIESQIKNERKIGNRMKKLASDVEQGNVIKNELTKDQQQNLSHYLPSHIYSRDQNHNFTSIPNTSTNKKFDPKKIKIGASN